MTGQRYRWGLASRFFVAQLLVVAASILAAVIIASLVGPVIFHEHLVMAGHSENSPELLHAEQAYRDTSVWTLAVALGTAVVCAATVAWLFTRRIQHPLAALTEAAQAMARGRYDARVPAVGAGVEVDALATSFNVMAERLEHTEDTRRRMLSDLAHEMRTPISVLTVYREALHDGVACWDETISDLVGDQLARLTRLVEDINDVSRAEEGRIVLVRTAESVAELLRVAAETAREAYAAKGVSLRVEDGTAAAQGAGTVEVDRQRMGQVLGNLLSNALRHTPSGGQVILSTARSGPGRIALRVTDTGDGITPEQLPHVFDRFYRGDTARDRDHGGVGIGLSISKALVEAHGGTLTATSLGVGAGAAFTVQLRRVGASAARTPDNPLAKYPRGVHAGGGAVFASPAVRSEGDCHE